MSYFQNPQTEKTHFFERNIETQNHDCPFCNEQFYYSKSKFTPLRDEGRKSFSYSGSRYESSFQCNDPGCIVCGRGQPKNLEKEEVYEYKRDLPLPCQICGDCSFNRGVNESNILTLIASRFMNSTYRNVDISPVTDRKIETSQIIGSPQGFVPINSSGKINIKTPKTEYEDVFFYFFYNFIIIIIMIF